MRRTISVLLAAGMLVGLLAVPATAQDKQADITTTVVGSSSFDILEDLVIEAGVCPQALVLDAGWSGVSDEADVVVDTDGVPLGTKPCGVIVGVPILGVAALSSGPVDVAP